jgi:signal transduction histidine kinase
LVLAVFAAAIATSGVFEWRYYPERVPSFLAFFAAQLAVCGALIGFRGLLQRRHLLTVAVTLAAAILGFLLITYDTVTGSDSELLGIALVCLLAGLSLLLPWRAGGQIAVAVAILLGFALHLAVSPPPSVPAPYVFFAVFCGAFISALGAYYVDLHRFAAFREGTLKDEAAHETRALLRIASELNSSLEARTMLDRIARSARDALACDWSVILLWDERREVFRVAAADSQATELGEELRGMEFGAGDLPPVEKLLADGDLIEVSEARPPDDATAAFMARYGTRSLLVTNMVRVGRVVGLLAAGRTNDGRAFLPREQHLACGIAQHAAVALENARLVSDLRHADRMKSEFVATMSHELRSPLNIILGYSDLLLEDAYGTLTAEQRDTIERLRQNATDLLTLINATLDVNRLEAGRLPVELEDFRVADLMSDIRAEIERVPRPDTVALKWSVGVDGTLRSDPKKIKIILRNLITNALKFTDRGQVAVTASRPHGSAVEFSIADTGIGIPPDELANIFGMFRQVKTAARKSGGVGLGLYIVQRFVNLLRGDVTVRSSLGTGTTFHVRIPDLGVDRKAA